ncbi:uncharacterized protein EI97DRAFT_462559 [Westerdykella ornata]|uniref:Uncharacterized protein n=1 Tax=Westerdykella ornata TaxID=318751 RepID=A0A6A6J6C5_WESOR|nr:uncharacterized protein EI97DRAFT_462559 [Westerdykella ornata]KAF2271764.1 hypothetical protein EI97DRAFT_462559 [Westerdykella ornata]
MSRMDGTPRRARLSEENLRMHNAACLSVSILEIGRDLVKLTAGNQESNGYQISLIQQERALLYERESFAHCTEFSAGKEPKAVKTEIESRNEESQQRQRSLDALKLYTGVVPSSESPMSRFMAMSPTNDTHSWMAKQVMEESGIGYGELEALELRKLASELVDNQANSPPEDTMQATVGSPCPSSDTLSMRQLIEWREARKGARVRRHIGMRRGRKRQEDVTASGVQGK